MRRIQTVVVSVVVATLAVVALASPAHPQTAILVRDLGPIQARSTERVGLSSGTFMGLFEFANGRVLLNDAANLRLVLFDSSLTKFTVTGDTTGALPITYRPLVSPLVPFVGDSVLFLDFQSRTMALIGSNGSVIRAVAPAKYSDMIRIRANSGGADPGGRLVYRGLFPARSAATASPFANDSQPIVRANFDTRVVDTLAVILKPSDSPPLVQTPSPDGMVSFKILVRPILWIDDWTMLPDGTIAIVRGRDYHIDWINPDGTRWSSPKMPFDWRRVDDAGKQKLIDSVRTVLDARDLGGRGGMSVGEARSHGAPEEQLHVVTNADGSKTVPVGVEFVPLKDIPDYVAPMRTGAVRADPEGRIWILPTTSAQSRKGGLVYDIVNRKGEITERVELPAGRLLAGFGRGGAVYLLSNDKGNGFLVERARFK